MFRFRFSSQLIPESLYVLDWWLGLFFFVFVYSTTLVSCLWVTDVQWAVLLNESVLWMLLEHLRWVFLAPNPSSSTVLTQTLWKQTLITYQYLTPIINMAGSHTLPGLNRDCYTSAFLVQCGYIPLESKAQAISPWVRMFCILFNPVDDCSARYLVLWTNVLLDTWSYGIIFCWLCWLAD
jgi:hypothetical protein